jgi:hypothetical protein
MAGKAEGYGNRRYGKQTGKSAIKAECPGLALSNVKHHYIQ